MAKIKSMGLEGAKRAVRKLFGRQPSPAGNSSPVTGTSTGSNDRDDGVNGPRRGEGGDDSLNLDGGHNHDDKAFPDASRRESSGPDDTTSRQRDKAQEGEIPSPVTTDQKEATISRGDGDDASTDEAMVPILVPKTHKSSQQHEKMEQKNIRNENQRYFTSGPGSDKENQPPDDAYGNILASPMKQLNLDPDNNILKTKQLEDEAGLQTPEEELTEEEKAFRAEREKHLVFIEEALDMVRFLL